MFIHGSKLVSGHMNEKIFLSVAVEFTSGSMNLFSLYLLALFQWKQSVEYCNCNCINDSELRVHIELISLG